MRRASLPILILLFAWTPLPAQVNVERMRIADTATGWSGQVELGFSVRTGNVRHTQFDPSSRIDFVTPGVESFLVMRGDVGIQGGRRYSNAGLMHVRATRRRGRFAPEAFAQINYDRSQRLLFRWLAGSGVRVRMVSGPRAAVRLGTALMYEYEHLDLDTAAMHPGETRKLRWSNYVSLRAASPAGARFIMTAYAQPDLGDFADARVLVESTAAAPLVGGVALTLTAWARLDTRPPDDVKRHDAELRSGVAVAF